MAEYEFFLLTDDGSLKENTRLWEYYDLVNKAAVKLGIFSPVYCVIRFGNAYISLA